MSMAPKDGNIIKDGIAALLRGLVGSPGDTGGSQTSGTVMAKENELLKKVASLDTSIENLQYGLSAGCVNGFRPIDMSNTLNFSAPTPSQIHEIDLYGDKDRFFTVFEFIGNVEGSLPIKVEFLTENNEPVYEFKNGSYFPSPRSGLISIYKLYPVGGYASFASSSYNSATDSYMYYLYIPKNSGYKMRFSAKEGTSLEKNARVDVKLYMFEKLA